MLRSDPVMNSFVALNQQAAEKARLTKQLRPKLQEYESRAAAMPAQSNQKWSTAASVAKLVELEREILKLEDREAKLSKQLGEYKGLPNDLKKAQKTVGKLRDEVQGLRRRRDQLFEGIGK